MTLAELLESDLPVSCVVQGGGMRGTYSIAALAELERLGYTNRFTSIYGSSAGALNGAYFLARQAAEGVRIYVDHLSNRRFIRFTRWPLIDIDYLIDDVLTTRVPLNQRAVVESATNLFVYVTRARTATVERFNARDRTPPLMEVLRATAAMPLAFGREVAIDGEPYVDGGFIDQVPLLDALADGCRHIVVILTRPSSFRFRPASPALRWILRRAAAWRGHSAAIVDRMGTECGPINRVMAIVAGEVASAGASIWIVAPREGERIASRLTSEKSTLEETARKAERQVRQALGQGPVASRG